jgi:hypothetical protein
MPMMEKRPFMVGTMGKPSPTVKGRDGENRRAAIGFP